MGKGLTLDDYRRCAESGMSQAEAARALGVSRQMVNIMAHKHGLWKARADVTAAKVERVRLLMAEGLSITAIAAELGHNRLAVYDIARRHGITLNDGRKNYALRDRVAELDDLGWRQVDIARTIGISQGHVSTLLINMGRHRRSRKAA